VTICEIFCRLTCSTQWGIFTLLANKERLVLQDDDDVNMLDIDGIVDGVYPLNVSHAGGEFEVLLDAGMENR